MADRTAVLAALNAHTNKPATAHELRAQPGEVFAQPAFLGLAQFTQSFDTLTELNALVADVAPLIRAADPFRGSSIAINCGTLVEWGADPDVVFPHLLAELPRHLALARRALERNAASPGALFDADPDAAKAAAGLVFLLLATMTVICRKAAYRQALRANPEIRANVEALRESSREADFVAQVLDLIDDVDLLVLAPNERKGFRVRLEAVNYNAHLFTLLQAALIGGGHLEGEPLDEEVVAVARGEAAPTHVLTDHARFHFSPWYELTSDDPFVGSIGAIVALPVDGNPAGIPEFHGVPVVLIGPKVFGSRQWDNGFFANIHDALKSRAEIIEVLPPERVDEWLDRIRRAATKS